MFRALQQLALRCGYVSVETEDRMGHDITPEGMVLVYYQDSMESLVHELCHWATATPEERKLHNLGMQDDALGIDEVSAPCEHLVFWLEFEAYSAFDIPLLAHPDFAQPNPSKHPEGVRLRDDDHYRVNHPRWGDIPPWFSSALAESIRSDYSDLHRDVFPATHQIRNPPT